MHKGKRGQYSTIELWFLVAAFLLASVAGIDLLRDASSALDRTLLEKNYIARDLAMAIEAVYASPGDIDFVYNLGGYRYRIDVVGGRVVVKDGLEEVSYRIIGVPASNEKYKSYGNPDGLKVLLPDFVTARVLEVKECKKPASIILSKKFGKDGSSRISLAGKNAILVCERAGSKVDEGCAGKVVKCE